MKINVNHRGGYDMSANIQRVIERFPTHWVALLPFETDIVLVEMSQLPHIHNVWGCHDNLDRHWQIRLSTEKTSRLTTVFVHTDHPINTHHLYVFERDIATAIILSLFENERTAITIKRVIKMHARKKYHLDIFLAELLSAFIVNRNLAESFHLSLVIGFFEAVDRELRSEAHTI